MKPMSRPAASTVAVVAGILVVVAGVAGIVVATTDGATAVHVGDRRVSRASVNDELAVVAANRDLIAAVGQDRVSGSPGTVRAGAAAALVGTGVVQEALILEYLEQRGERVRAGDRDGAEELLPQTSIGQVFDGFPRWYQQRYRERLAAYVALARVLGTDPESEDSTALATRALRRQAARSGVSVDPRYGWFSARVVQVVPPTVTPEDIARASG